MVFLESAFDYFCHCIIKYGFHRIIQNDWKATEKFENFMIPMSVVKKARETDDEQYYEDFLNEKISPMTFLDPKLLGDNLNLIYSEMLVDLAKEVFSSDKQPLKRLKSGLKRNIREKKSDCPSGR